jgi:antitoxin MazE
MEKEADMHARVEAHPGGVAVVVPQALAALAGLHSGGRAEIAVSGNGLVVRPAGTETLADLLAGITPDNLHGEWAAGPPVGAEVL